MAIPSIFSTAQTGLTAAKAGIATTGHNITNSSTEGYSRQRVITSAEAAGGAYGKHIIGTGTKIARVERVNDEYIEKQMRAAMRDLSYFEEGDLALKQVEDIFNEMNGDGLNRLISRFFNEFRKLSDEPDSPAVRQSVREATQAVTSDFKRLRTEMEDVRRHLDSRVEGYVREVNSLVSDLCLLNQKIREIEAGNGTPNDLLDQRDMVLKKLSTFLDVSIHKSSKGLYDVEIKGVGPLVTADIPQQLLVETSPADASGKPEGAFDLKTTADLRNPITHQLRGGKLGALVRVRDQTVSSILDRLDEMAYALTNSVNQVHRQGFTLEGDTLVDFFRPLAQKERAAEFISLSDPVTENINNIAAAWAPDSPGDNRIAIEITKLQNEKLMGNGYATADAWYNSIVSDVGVAVAQNRFALNQQKDIMTQLNRVRDQISGVSVDEETTNLLQFQHAFDASARVIQVADDLLKTVLSLMK